jgi:hypothetical protein
LYVNAVLGASSLQHVNDALALWRVERRLIHLEQLPHRLADRLLIGVALGKSCTNSPQPASKSPVLSAWTWNMDLCRRIGAELKNVVLRRCRWREPSEQTPDPARPPIITAKPRTPAARNPTLLNPPIRFIDVSLPEN